MRRMEKRILIKNRELKDESGLVFIKRMQDPLTEGVKSRKIVVHQLAILLHKIRLNAIEYNQTGL